MIWVPGVRGLDITDGHIDGSVRIVRPGVLMMAFNPEDTTENADAQAKPRTFCYERAMRVAVLLKLSRLSTGLKRAHGVRTSSRPTLITMS
ncbi:MAG: hypothetical protein IPL62_08490 [Caulobacteraceae bacterium]|nr:hypothetical protein [Caulobacteraceae bacterium]